LSAGKERWHDENESDGVPGKRERDLQIHKLANHVRPHPAIKQKQGLAWMIKMEHPILPKKIEDPPVQLWQMKKDEDVRN
jgi:SWI/SNF-related matrix-associated actin-dependent regulator of chromatin subfamily A3